MAPADDGDDLAQRLAGYCLAQLRDQGVERTQVSGLARIFGGASRETWRFQLHEWRQGVPTERPLILRRDPGASLIDTERRVEYAALQMFAGSQVPVPRVLWLEEDAQALGSPFFIMEQITGCESAPPRLMAEPYLAHHPTTAQEKWTILGRIAQHPVAALAPLVPAVTAQEGWKRELDHWSAILDRESVAPQPVMAAAIRWLRAHPPPPAQRLSVVHGDYRTGNLLIDPQGHVRAVLDWEMAHVGDPLEDLAWGINRAWSFRPGLAGGLVPRAVALAHWEAASGLQADAEALHWWELFSCVKGQAIWQTAGHAMQSGANPDLMMAFAAWSMANTQDRVALDLMGRL